MTIRKCTTLIGGAAIVLCSLFNHAFAHGGNNHHNGKDLWDRFDQRDIGRWGIKKHELREAWINISDLWPRWEDTIIGKRFEPGAYDPISDYQTDLPHTAYPMISTFERNLLRIYLENPDNVHIAKILALFNLKKSLLVGHRHDGNALKSTVIGLYFLHRVREYERDNLWVNRAIRKVEHKLEKYIHPNRDVDNTEGSFAHRYFIDAFNYNEQNRYHAGNILLNSYLSNPDNVFTSFYIMASHSWISGEERYNDPVVLNNVITAAYFSLRTMDLARKAEESWSADPENYARFRMATIVGGLSMISRQWLAALHGDPMVEEALNDEHREWRLRQKPFHAFTAGYTFFEDWSTFEEGMAAWDDAFNECTLYPEQRTCGIRPRFSFNPGAMMTGYSDFFMKAGLPDVARIFLDLAYVQDGFDIWYLGQDAWQHRVDNVDAIVEKYQNDDPEDDPIPFMMAKTKWGRNLQTCQVCHQVQGRVWTPEEREEIILPLEQYATVGIWPAVSASWYGALTGN